RDEGAEDRDPQAVADRLEERRGREVSDVVGEADELFLRPLEALGEHETERQRERSDQVEPDDADEEAHEPIVAARLWPDDRGGKIPARRRGVRALRCSHARTSLAS